MPEFGQGRASWVRIARLVIGPLFLPVIASPALSQALRFAPDGRVEIDSVQVAWMVALIAAICVAVASAAALIRARALADKERIRLQQENGDLKLAADRAEAVLNADDQRVVFWTAREEAPIVMGSLPESSGMPRPRVAFLAFGQWLEPISAKLLEEKIDLLRTRGDAFCEAIRTQIGTYVEASGRIAGSLATVRFRNLTRERLEYVELKDRAGRLKRDIDTLHSLADSLSMPMWTRDHDGKLNFVNRAYARAVESADAGQAIQANLELLDTAGRDAVASNRARSPVFQKRLSMVVGGERRFYDIVDVLSGNGSAGIATDVSEFEKIQTELRRTSESHSRTLDQLASAVAIFGPDKRLQFYNAAYRALFGLDTAFLESGPEDGAVLDQLRTLRRLPEQADYRSWKRDLLASYQSLETREFWWHQPDGQTLRVIANPHPQGGITYVYENVTERLDLESRYNALIRVQGETLDHLSEGVAVFGSDGRLRLWNPSFAQLWQLNDKLLQTRPHVNEVIAKAETVNNDRAAWDRVRMAVAGLADTRMRVGGRLERRDGSVIDFVTVPLPDGATLITFVNVTDTVNVERALKDKNIALETADKLKNEFIQHVSYELRSPLTNIIGFAQLLADETAGPLKIKQREYTGYIMDSSASLLAIINDILDLATVDAGVMELDLSEVEIASTVHSAMSGLKDRLAEAHINLVANIPTNLGAFVADEKRVRQILFNLLSNAVAFSADGGTIQVNCDRDDREVRFTISDEGRGIPQDYIDAVFRRFESRSAGSRRRGAGLGLSIVKSFVELHGGMVDIQSREGQGTSVTCHFPLVPMAAAAE